MFVQFEEMTFFSFYQKLKVTWIEVLWARQAFACSKSTVETPEQYVEYVQS